MTRRRDFCAAAAFLVTVTALVAAWAGTPLWLAMCGIAMALVLCVGATQ